MAIWNTLLPVTRNHTEVTGCHPTKYMLVVLGDVFLTRRLFVVRFAGFASIWVAKPCAALADQALFRQYVDLRLQRIK